MNRAAKALLAAEALAPGVIDAVVGKRTPYRHSSQRGTHAQQTEALKRAEEKRARKGWKKG